MANQPPEEVYNPNGEEWRLPGDVNEPGLASSMTPEEIDYWKKFGETDYRDL